jgi:hypothetical protein
MSKRRPIKLELEKLTPVRSETKMLRLERGVVESRYGAQNDQDHELRSNFDGRLLHRLAPASGETAFRKKSRGLLHYNYYYVRSKHERSGCLC